MEVTYAECSHCGTISPQDRWTTGNPQACPECQSSRDSIPWPPAELSELAALVLAFDQKSAHYSPVTCVFTSSLLESLLEHQVYMMAMMDMDYNDAGLLADLLLESYQGRTRLIHLYKRVGYSSLADDASHAGCPRFPADWDQIANARNDVIHGKPEAAKAITPDLIRRAVSDAFTVFSYVHNAYNIESHRYKSATPNTRVSDEGKKRLAKWSQSASLDSEETHDGGA